MAKKQKQQIFCHGLLCGVFIVWNCINGQNWLKKVMTINTNKKSENNMKKNKGDNVQSVWKSFDPEWYSLEYPDVKLSGLTPLQHYIWIGLRLGRKPNGNFIVCNDKGTTKNNEDINNKYKVESIYNNKFGSEDKNYEKFCLENGGEQHIVEKSGYFDAAYYLLTNPDVKKRKISPLVHFCKNGWKEKRNPSANFDIDFYVNTYEEAKKSRINPVVYHVLFGEKKKWHTVPRSIKNIGAKKSSEIVDKYICTETVDWYDYKKSELFREVNKQADPLENFDDRLKGLIKQKIKERSLTVSVIMPTWNRQKYISRSLQSALTQSYQPLEVIVIDDGSIDGTDAVIQQEFSEELKIGLVKLISTKHLGVSNARNVGLELAKGDLVAYLDSDNLWRADYLLIMVAFFSEFDEFSTAYAALKHVNLDTGKYFVRGYKYDRRELLHNNFIDLNVFMHRKQVYKQIGCFDTTLNRLVDWDYIIRCTALYRPVYVNYVGVEYFIGSDLNNITNTVHLDYNKQHLYLKHSLERFRYGLERIHFAYVLWDWPALSQTFVVSEIKWLVEHGQDVIVYYSINPDKSTKIDFEVESHMVSNADELAELFVKHKRNICHAHFAYPCTTLLAYPACVKANIKFTFFAHAVDIFCKKNAARNLIDKIVHDDLCLCVFVHGEYHRQFLQKKGVPQNKIYYNFQAVTTSNFGDSLDKHKTTNKKCIFVGRFVEKKGVEILLNAANLLKKLDVSFYIYGFGPLRKEYEETIKSLGLVNTHVCGPLENRDSLLNVFKTADFLVVPSIVANNGDTEGFPTVIFEAMAANIPVITSNVAAVPDYFRDGIEAVVVEQGDASALANGIRRLINMTDSDMLAMTRNANKFLKKNVSVDITMNRYFEVWMNNLLEIFIVTYCPENDLGQNHTIGLINDVLRETTTPFILTVVDNGSCQQFLDKVIFLCEKHKNVKLLLLKNNIFCGPASNKALTLSDCDFAIYLCSKEAKITRHGWERPLVDYMRNNSECALAGYKTHLPKFTLGKELITHPDFLKFRNKDYAINNPEKHFMHIQGGAFIARTSVINSLGGFSNEFPQANMDVELSFFLESAGYKISRLDNVVSISNKTLPKIHEVIDEKTVVLHPLPVSENVDIINRTKIKQTWYCSFCDSINTDGTAKTCKKCGSTAFSRLIYRRICHDWRAFRSESAVIVSEDLSLKNKIAKKMFTLLYSGVDIPGALNASQGGMDLFIIDRSSIKNDREDNVFFNAILSAMKLINRSGLILATIDDSKIDYMFGRLPRGCNVKINDTLFSSFHNTDNRLLVEIER